MKLLTLPQLEQEIEELNLNLRARAHAIRDAHESHALLQAAENTRIMLAWVRTAIKRKTL